MLSQLIFLFSLSKPVPKYVPEVVGRWGDALEVTVVARECGQENAYYFPADDTVVLCTELFNRPELTRAILNHELAHAYFDQHDIPMGGQEEYNADELSWFFCTGPEIIAVTQWHLDDASSDLSTDDPEEGHPASLSRALMYITLDMGYRHETRESFMFYRSAWVKWSVLLELADR